MGLLAAWRWTSCNSERRRFTTNSSVVSSTALHYVEIPMTHTSVSPRLCRFSHGKRTDIHVGWVKEQSLAGIVDWFEYWLGQAQ